MNELKRSYRKKCSSSPFDWKQSSRCKTCVIPERNDNEYNSNFFRTGRPITSPTLKREKMCRGRREISSEQLDFNDTYNRVTRLPPSIFIESGNDGNCITTVHKTNSRINWPKTTLKSKFHKKCAEKKYTTAKFPKRIIKRKTLISDADVEDILINELRERPRFDNQCYCLDCENISTHESVIHSKPLIISEERIKKYTNNTLKNAHKIIDYNPQSEFLRRIKNDVIKARDCKCSDCMLDGLDKTLKYTNRRALIENVYSDIPESEPYVPKKEIQKKKISCNKDLCKCKIQRASEIRGNNYFETHSVEDLQKKVPEHKCVHRFKLDDRLLPTPVNTDCYGQSRCDICYKPYKNSNSDSPTSNNNKDLKIKLKNYVDNIDSSNKNSKSDKEEQKWNSTKCICDSFSLTKNCYQNGFDSKINRQTDTPREICNIKQIKCESRLCSQQNSGHSSNGKSMYQQKMKNKSSEDCESVHKCDNCISAKSYTISNSDKSQKSKNYERNETLRHYLNHNCDTTSASSLFKTNNLSEMPIKRYYKSNLTSKSSKNKEQYSDCHTNESATKSSLGSKNKFDSSQFKFDFDYKSLNNLSTKLSSTCRKINIGDGDKVVVLNTDIDDSKMPRTFFEKCKKNKFRPNVSSTNTYALRYQKGVM